jgi:Lon protease-like protein
VSLLPLFPLDVVLLPGSLLPLHIFEPRYREMTAECLDQKTPFGIIHAKEEGLAEIGCTAEIIAVTKQYPDGRSDILTRGTRRFEVMRINQERSFLRAEILYLEDDPENPTAEEVAQATSLHAQLIALAGATQEDSETAKVEGLSFRLVAALPLDLDFKQTLLGMKSEADRVRAIISYFETILPSIQRNAKVRKKAGGNGHVM